MVMQIVTISQKIKKFSFLPPRIFMFLGRCITDIVPIKVNISKKLHCSDTMYVLCKEHDGTLNHLLINCFCKKLCGLVLTCCKLYEKLSTKSSTKDTIQNIERLGKSSTWNYSMK